MAQYTPTVVGIDVSKTHLDVFCYPAGSDRRFENTKRGWRALASWVAPLSTALLVYEATGPYHRGMERYLGERGIAVARLDPRRARRFAEAIGLNAKTDPVDARMLARFGALLEPSAMPLPAPALESLKELVAARRGLVQQRTRLANKGKVAESALLKRQLRQSDRLVRRQIKEIDAACRTLVRADPTLARRFHILLSIPAIGDITAMTLLAEMPELGTLDAKQTASLLGVAPIANDSGTFKGKRHIRGGRAQVRQAVYMATLVAARHNADLKRKYQDLVTNGKPPKVALTAIMRNLAILANALLRDNRTWAEISPCS